MDEVTQKAFDFASDLTKQLITLSTAILTLTAVLTKLIFERVPKRMMPTLRAAWMFYLASILFGIAHLMALTGTLARPPSGKLTAESIYGSNARIHSLGQVITFLLGTILIIRYAWPVASADEADETVKSSEETSTGSQQPVPTTEEKGTVNSAPDETNGGDAFQDD